MTIDAQVQQFLERLAKLNLPDVHEIPVTMSRRASQQRRLALPPGPKAEVSDHQVPVTGGSVLARLYRPLPLGAASATVPVLVWFHGGGFTLGSVAESDSDCRHLADKARCAVLSVDYRLAPEFKYPTALHDCAAALRWVYEKAAELGLDSDRVAVGGDSAGGALAASTCLYARDHGERVPSFQLLIYPITDISSFSTASYEQNAEGYYLTRQAMQWFAEQYAAEQERRNGYVSPLQAESLRDLPPAFIMTAEYDPLRDEGELYAKQLTEAGVHVEVKRYDGMIHGFFSMHDYLEAGRRALHDASAALRSALVG